MRDEEMGPGGTFATWFRNARIARGWTQEQLIEATGGEVSKSSLNRWENGKAIGELSKIRIAVVAMGADPREASVALGLVTREEWDLPPMAPLIDQALVEPAQILGDQRVDELAKKRLREYVAESVVFWKRRAGLRNLKEPSADERAAGKPVKVDEH